MRWGSPSTRFPEAGRAGGSRRRTSPPPVASGTGPPSPDLDVAPGPAPAHPERSADAGGAESTGAPAEERIPLRGMRKRIAENMARSKRTAAHFTFVEQCDVTELVRVKERMVAGGPGGGREGHVPPVRREGGGGGAPQAPAAQRHHRRGAERARRSSTATTSASRPRPTPGSSCRWCAPSIACRCSSSPGRSSGSRQATRAGQVRARGPRALHLHGDEPRRARRPVRDAGAEPPRGRDPRHPPHPADAGGPRTARS